MLQQSFLLLLTSVLSLHAVPVPGLLNNASAKASASLTAAVSHVAGAYATAGVDITPNKNALLPDIKIKLCADLWLFDPHKNACVPPEKGPANVAIKSQLIHKPHQTTHQSPEPHSFKFKPLHKPTFRPKTQPIKFHPKPAPQQSPCGPGLKPHPTLVDICIAIGFDIEVDLSISQPHHYWLSDGVCSHGQKLHPKLVGICIDLNVDYSLDLGLFGARPNAKGFCPANWRSHATIANLCLSVKVDIVIMNGHDGRLFDQDNRCTAGWNPHPTVIGLCVDSALSLDLFTPQRPTAIDGVCQPGYIRHPTIVNLCLVLDLSIDRGLESLPGLAG